MLWQHMKNMTQGGGGRGGAGGKTVHLSLNHSKRKKDKPSLSFCQWSPERNQ